MKIISRSRGAYKTTEAIKKAYLTGATLVCSSNSDVQRVRKIAQKMKMGDIPIITMDNQVRGLRMDFVIIDDIDR